MAGTTMLFVMVSPVERVISSVAFSSRGSELSLVKGMRRGLPAMANVGTSKLARFTSGSRVSAPAGTVKTGVSRIRRRVAACEGASPVFQSPSLSSTTLARRPCFSINCDSAAWMSVPSAGGCCAEEKGSKTTSIRFARGSHALGSRKGRARSERASGSAAGCFSSTMSRVSMLRDTSWRIASVGRASGLNTSRHSGRLSVIAMPVAMSTRSSSSHPINRRKPLRCQLIHASTAIPATKAAPAATENGEGEKTRLWLAVSIGSNLKVGGRT